MNLPPERTDWWYSILTGLSGTRSSGYIRHNLNIEKLLAKARSFLSYLVGEGLAPPVFAVQEIAKNRPRRLTFVI